MAVTSRQIGVQVLDALGLSARSVASIKLEMRHDDVVRIEVEMLPTEQEAIGVFDVIKRYQLVEVSEDVLMRTDGEAVQDVTSLGDQVRRYARIDACVAAAKQKISLMANGFFSKVGAEHINEIIKKCGRYS